MIPLDYAGTRKLQLVTAQNGASVVVGFSDFDTSTKAYDRGVPQCTTVSSATTTDICATPASGKIRDVDSVFIANTYAGSNAMTLQVASASGGPFVIENFTLLQNESAEYTHGSGVRIKDASGQYKVTLTGTAGAFAVGGALSVTGASTVAAITASGLATFNAGATVASGQTLTLTGATVAGAPTWSSTQSLNTSGNAATVTTNANLTGPITSVGNATTIASGNTYTNPTLSGTVGGTPAWTSAQAITLSTAAQPNVTSVGTLTGLTVSGLSSTFSSTDTTTGAGVAIGPTMQLRNIVGAQGFWGNNVDRPTTQWQRIVTGIPSAFRMIAGVLTYHVGPTGNAGTQITDWDTSDVKFTISATGAVTIPGLAGTGSRHVMVDANGVLSAP